MTQERVKGFVVGSDPGAHGKKLWKIRVNENGHPLNSKKLIAFSGEKALASGLDVDFVIGSAKQTPVAVDVRILTVAQAELTSTRETRDEEVSDTFNLADYELDGSIDVFITPFTSPQKVQTEIKLAGGDENVIAFKSFTRDDLGDAFDLMCSLEFMQDSLEAFEEILTDVFKLGVTYRNGK